MSSVPAARLPKRNELVPVDANHAEEGGALLLAVCLDVCRGGAAFSGG